MINFTEEQDASFYNVLIETFSLMGFPRIDALLKLMPHVIVAGGAVSSTLRGEEIKDYDVFFTDPEAFTTAFKAARATLEEDKEQEGLFLGTLAKKAGSCYGRVNVSTSNAVSFGNRVQIITRFVGEPKNLFTTFDFEHCKVYWKPNVVTGRSTVHFAGDSLQALLSNKLIYNGGSRFILSALRRHEKFKKRGWKSDDMTLFALAKTASKLDWNNPKVIDYQLAGYYGKKREEMNELIKQLRD